MKKLLNNIISAPPESESVDEDLSPTTYKAATAFTAVVSTALVSIIGYTAVYSIISLFAGM